MKSKIPIIRTLFGDDPKTRREISPISIIQPQIVYVWGTENEKWLNGMGYETRLQHVNSRPPGIRENSLLYTKLVSVDLALQEFGEIIFLDWDCYVLREFDDNFYNYLKEKPIQCPLYSHYKNPMEAFKETSNNRDDSWMDFHETLDKTFRIYSWKKDDMLIAPNFGFFYSRDITIGKKLLDIVDKHKLYGCVDELSFFIYVNCSLDEYIDKYHPVMVQGVAQDMTINDLLISKVQREFNDYIDTKLKMDIYMKHM